MAIQNLLINKLLRLITPEEIGDIATKHNGGKFLSLTDLVNERVERKIYRDFSSPGSMDEIHDAHSVDNQAKILPFTKKVASEQEDENSEQESDKENLTNELVLKVKSEPIAKEIIEHKDDENMSSFILIEKARLKRSQYVLKQKEIIDLYRMNANVEVEQIKNSNNDFDQDQKAGVLVNKKQY